MAKTNNINAVVIEGMLTEAPMYDAEHEVCILKFEIQSNQKHTCFTAKAFGVVGKTCSTSLTSGDFIRMCGKLDVEGNNVIIISEHIEFQTDKTRQSA